MFATHQHPRVTLHGGERRITMQTGGGPGCRDVRGQWREGEDNCGVVNLVTSLPRTLLNPNNSIVALGWIFFKCFAG